MIFTFINKILLFGLIFEFSRFNLEKMAMLTVCTKIRSLLYY